MRIVGRMKLTPLRISCFTLLSLLLLLSPPVLNAQGVIEEELAGEIFLKAYLLREDGMRFEREGNPGDALRSYREAARHYDELARRFPAWKPAIVGLRRKEMNEKVADFAGHAPIEQRPATQPPGPTQGREPIGPRTGQQPPPVDTTGADDLPTWEQGPPASPQPHTETPLTIRPPEAEQAPGQRESEQLQALERRQQQMEKIMADLHRDKNELEKALRESEEQSRLGEYELRLVRQERNAAQNALTTLQEDQINERIQDNAEIKAMREDIAGYEKQLSEVEDQRQSLLTHIEEKDVALAAADKEMDTLRMERQQLIEQRDNLSNLLAIASEDSSEAVQEVIQRNIALEEQLAEARNQLAELQSSSEEKDSEIAQLRTRLSEMEEELTLVRSENASYRDQVAKLQSILEETEGRLTEESGALTDRRLIEENEVLRSIVVQQLRDQAYRQRAKGLILSELAKLQIDSRLLLDLLDQMEGKGTDLSPEDIARINDPHIEALLGLNPSEIFFANDPSDPASDGIDSQSGRPGINDLALIANDPGSRDIFRMQKSSMARSAAADFENGNFASAEDTYRLIVEADPRDVRMISNLGVTLLRRNKYDEAVQRFSQALEINEKNDFAHLMLGVTLWRQEKLDQAVDRVHRSLAIRPNNPQAHLYLGIISMDRGSFGPAHAALSQALEFRPDYAAAHYNLAVLYTKPGFADPEEATKHYREATRLGLPRDLVLERFLQLDTASS